jgi:hypothetical protein
VTNARSIWLLESSVAVEAARWSRASSLEVLALVSTAMRVGRSGDGWGVVKTSAMAMAICLAVGAVVPEMASSMAE